MFVPFETLENTARIWIYQSARKFTESETNTIFQTLSSFTDQWNAHEHPLKSSFKIFYDQFIVLAADEAFNAASGCSIDSSVRVIKAMDERYVLDLFDRTRVAFLKDDAVLVLGLNELSKELSNNTWRQDTLTFNNTISTKSDLETRWIVPAGETWLKRYLPTVRQA